MERNEIHENFIAFMEKERIVRGLSIAEMAKRLGIPFATYKNIIYHKSECIDISIACRLHDLTGHWMFEMCGYPQSCSEVINQYLRLNDDNKVKIMGIAGVLEDLQQ